MCCSDHNNGCKLSHIIFEGEDVIEAVLGLLKEAPRTQQNNRMLDYNGTRYEVWGYFHNLQEDFVVIDCMVVESGLVVLAGGKGNNEYPHSS